MYDPHHWIRPLAGADPHSPLAIALRAIGTAPVRPFAGLGDQVAICPDCGEAQFERDRTHWRACVRQLDRRGKGWRLPR